MATTRSGQTSNPTDAIGRFLRNAEANSQTLTSPDGKVLARQFLLSEQELTDATTYSIPDRHRIVSQLRLALADFYVHLERKKSIYGFDPVRALDLLGTSVESISDGEFHQGIVDLIARTRDRHLFFYGRTPLGVSAVLPFTIERCWQGSDAKYVVTKVASGFKPKQLQVGAFVTHWNGIPIERFVRLSANTFDGGNEAASLARSLEFLTYRSLSRFATPLEEWVDLRFSVQGITYEERFTWQGFDTTQTPATPSIGRNLTGFGGDLELLHLQHAKRVRFAPRSFDTPPARPPTPAETGVPQIIGTDGSGNFDYGSVTTKYGTYGYVRLWAFSANGPDDIVNAFIPALSQLPRNGLIIDMRGNSGGYIAAGERVLQLFTSQHIKPTRFQFRLTPATQAMVNATDEFKVWKRSFDDAFDTGEPFSQGFPIEGTDEDANQIGQRYFGPVVLISDALAFSTADIFAAGFIDHDIGRLICIGENMAAAGGNNWYPWDVVRLYNPDFQLDALLKPTFDAGVLSQDVRNAFNSEGTSLSDKATMSSVEPQYDGPAWRITDGAISHVVRYLPWMNNPLRVYLDQGHGGLADMPAGVILSVTMRRCVRVRKNEGQLLEDLGIQPDVVYRMTFSDITDRNRDLITRASLELSNMPAYDLEIEVVPKGTDYNLVCNTLSLTSLEVFAGLRYVAGTSVSNPKPSELTIPGGLDKVEVRGFSGDSLVARAIVALA